MPNFAHQLKSFVYPVTALVALAAFGCGDPAAENAESSAATAEKTPAPKKAAAKSNGKAEVVPVKFVAPKLTKDEITDGWISLFDGVSLYGWHANSNANWRVDAGEIVADDGDNGLLMTAFEMPNYEFRCDFKFAQDGNSGVFLRCPAKAGNPAKDCYELNICDVHPGGFTTGGLVGRAKASVDGPTAGEWHTFHVSVDGPLVKVQLNGKQVLEYSDETEAPLTTGFIGLQKRVGEVRFKNIHLKPLHANVIFDGKSLDGWHEVAGSKSEFTVADGAIHVENGRGFLETDATWGDFVLQTEVKVNGDGLNSGIFFRSMKATEKDPSNGYECQIDNSLVDDDRSKPEDHGTGGIFKRIDARYVVGSDNEWTTTTLITQGPKIMTWVNGYQVVEWTDSRKPDENPRRGLRLDAGTIILQGHDPTTNLDFRNIRVLDLGVSE